MTLRITKKNVHDGFGRLSPLIGPNWFLIGFRYYIQELAISLFPVGQKDFRSSPVCLYKYYTGEQLFLLRQNSQIDQSIS